MKCIQNGQIYPSAKEAAQILGIGYLSVIHNLAGRTKTPKHGFTFKYVKGGVLSSS